MNVNSWFEMLNDKQKEAVIHENNPLLVLAGAGSGKTRVITTRIAYLIQEKGFLPASILAVTFTNKAALEMKERVSKMVGGTRGVMVRTFHSFGAWVLRYSGELLGLKPGFTIYDDDDSLSLLKTLYPAQPKNELKEFAKAISRAKDNCLTPEDDLKIIHNDPKFPEVYSKYETRLREIGNADFGDLIFMPIQLMEKYPEVQKRLQQRFQVLLVDEFQDSNIAQCRLVQMLTTKETWLCVVGDDDQSIYKFRGAEVDNILSFSDKFEGCDIIKLEQNYRSTQNILDAASYLVAHNQGRLGKTLWTEKEAGREIALTVLYNQKEEAEYAASIIQDSPEKETAILYRTNAQSRAFEDCFRRLQIPYKLIGNLSFYEREEVKDGMAYLSFFLNPYDEVAFRRIINKPQRGIGPGSLKIILGQSSLFGGQFLSATESAVELLKGKASNGANSWYNEMRVDIENDTSRTLDSFVRSLFKRVGLLDWYRDRDLKEMGNREGNLVELINSAAEYELSREGLIQFIENQELRATPPEEEDSENRVILITMHNTKGLEFERVIITGLEEGLFPSYSDIYDDESKLEEERRLFYVSITRAREELYITSCRNRMKWGRFEESFPSRFLRELPEELIELNNLPFASGGNFGSNSSKSDRDTDYPVGLQVIHEDYGLGVIYKNEVKGAHEVIFISFESGQNCRMITQFSEHKLEKLGMVEE